MSIETLIKAMRKDPKYRRLKASFDTLPMYQLDISQIELDLEQIHRMRPIRILYASDPKFIDMIIEANTMDQGARGRLTEILVTCSRSVNTLERACTAMKQHLYLTFADDLRALRTKDERMYVIDVCLSSFMRYIDKVQSVKDMANLIVTDIDKGSWSLKLSVSAMQVDKTRESRI